MTLAIVFIAASILPALTASLVETSSLSTKASLLLPCDDASVRQSGMSLACDAANALFSNYYNPSILGGVPSFFHDGSFWGDGVSLDGLLDLARLSSSTKLTEAVRTLVTHVHTRRPFLVIKTFSGCFVPDKWKATACSFDDPLWWSRMYAHADSVLGSRHLGTGPDFLATAKRVHDDVMAAGWGVARNGCAGGMCWKPPDETGRCYLNACTNGLALSSSLRLHIALEKSTINRTDSYLQQARMIWNWIEGSGIVDLQPNKIAAVNDGLHWPVNGTCSSKSTGHPFSYNQGLLIEGLVLLHDITGNTTLLVQGSRLAVAALELLTDSDDVFTEQTLSSRSSLYFKGVLVRSLRLLDGKLAAYSQVLDSTIIGNNSTALRQRIWKAVRASAASARDHAQTSSGLYCAKWQGPVNGSCVTPGGMSPKKSQHLDLAYCVGAPSQTSAVHLLITNGTIRSQDTRGQSLYV